MKKRFAVLGAFMATALFLTACGGSTGDTGGSDGDEISGSGTNEIWYSTKNSTELVHVAMAEGVTNAASEMGFKGKVAVAEADAARQNDQMNNLVQNINPEAIVVNPYDSDAISDVLGRAKDASIPIAVIDNKANNVEVDVSVLFNSLASGQVAGEKAVELLEAKNGAPEGVVVNMFGEVVSQVFKERSEGFEEVIKQYPDIELISVLGAPETDVATNALNNVIADAKASGKTIDVVNTPTDTATLGAIEALKTNDMWFKVGEADHVIVISHDGLGDIMDLVQEEYVDAEVVIDIYGVGGIAVEILSEYPLQGKPVPTSGTFTPTGTYLNTEVEFSEGDTGATVMLSPIVVDASGADNPLIWGNAG